MPSFNKAIIMGHLGKDPEIRYMENGTAVANFSVACTEKWKDKGTGEVKERTDWIPVVVWGKQAEICTEHLSKGDAVHVEGSIQVRKWEDRDGNDRWTTEIKASPFGITFLPSGKGKGKQSGGSNQGGLTDDDVPF